MNNQDKLGQSRILASLIFVLLLTVIAVAQSDIIQLEKTDYKLGELVSIKLNLIDFGNKSLKIISGNKLFTYSGSLRKDIEFKAELPGEYSIKLEDRTNLSIMDEAFFTVVNPDFKPSTSDLKITSDKEEYLLGEKVNINIQGNNLENHKLYLIKDSEELLYVGDLSEGINFPASGAGNYSVVLEDKDQNIVAKTSFVIKDLEETEEVIVEENTTQVPTGKILPEPRIINRPKTKIKRERIGAKIKMHDKVMSLKRVSDYYEKTDLEIDFPGIAEVNFEQLDIQGKLDLDIERLSEKKINIDQVQNALDVIAIDPSELDFQSASLTRKAKGTELWKCAQWNFTTQTCFGTWQKIMNLIPGQEYNITINASDPAFTEAGVATVNTKKPIYTVGETTELIMVVLDTEGFVVKNANLTLIVTSPDNTTTTFTTLSGQILETDDGVYEVNFTSTTLEGIYLLNVSAQITNIVQEMQSYFFVQNTYDFDIIRTMPVKIDPRDGFRVEFNITPLISVPTYNFTEVVPLNFTILSSYGAIVTNDSDYIYLTWTGLSGNSILNYTAKAPKIIPNVEVLGPSFVEHISGTFEEARPWYFAIDPETSFSTFEAGDIDMCPLSNTTFAIGWCQNEADPNDLCRLAVYYTNGTLIDDIDVDTSADIYSRISVGCYNTTDILVGYIDSTPEVLRVGRYRISGGSLSLEDGLDDVDTDMADGGEDSFDVATTIVSDTYGWIAAMDNQDEDSDHNRITISNLAIGGDYQADAETAADTPWDNKQDVCAISTTRIVGCWFDDSTGGANDPLSAIVFDENGVAQVAAHNIDTDIGGGGGISCACLRGDRVAYGYYESDLDDTVIQVRDYTGDSTSTILGQTSIDNNSGTSERVSTAEIEADGSSYFGVIFSDTNAGNIKAGIYDEDGLEVTSPFIITSDENTDELYRIVDIVGAQSNRGLNLCNGTFVAAYTRSDGQAYWQGFHINGSTWDGTCAAPPTPPTNIQCDGSDDCNITVTNSVVINASGSVDVDGDSITYSIEALLENITTVQNTTDFSGIGTSGTSSGNWGDDTQQASTTNVDSWFRCMGGTFSNTDISTLTGIFLSSGGSGNARVSVYQGGDLDDPNGANLIWDAGLLNAGSGFVGVTGGSNTLNPNNVTWVCVKDNDNTFTVHFDGSFDTSSDFQSARGRWEASGLSVDENVAFPATISGGGTSFGDFWYSWYFTYDNITAQSDRNTSFQTYTDVHSEYGRVSNITVVVEVDSYNPEGSVAQSNSDPDLELQIYDGSGYVGIGNFSLGSVYTGSGLDTTNQNFSLTTTDSTILSAWESNSNQDLRIRGVLMDYYNSSTNDEINYTNIGVLINGQHWIYIGNHTETTSFSWDTSSVPDQTNVDVRARAIDLDGSNSYSSYFTKGANMTLVGEPPPTINSMECYETGVGWGACSNIQFGEVLDAVRVNCTPANASIGVSNVSFSLENLDDSTTFFNNLTTDNSTIHWVLNMTDVTIVDSGTFRLTATCRENPESSNSTDWDVDFGNLSVTLITPTSNINVTQNQFFNWSSQVTCTGGECGWINATLDPPTNWWNSSWLKRRNLSIVNRGTTTLTNFPMYINVSYESGMNANFSDLVFLNDSCEEGSSLLDYEIENYTANYAIVWIRIPSLPSSGTTTCMYYENPTSGDNQNSESVWDSTFEAAWHMTELDTIDSTSNNNNLTENDDVFMNSSGRIGNNILFEGGEEDQVYTTSITHGIGTGDFTWAAWVYPLRLTNQYEGIMANTNFNPAIYTRTDNGGYGMYWGAVYQSGVTLSTGQWYYLVAQREGTTVRFYVDGTQTPTSHTIGSSMPNSGFVIGGSGQPDVSPTTSREGNELIDEVRFSNVARSEDWINQSIEMVTNQSGLVSFGSLELVPKGIIPVNSGTPFYTSNNNPQNSSYLACLANMSDGDSCTNTWAVNATGEANTTWSFFSIYESFNYSTNVTDSLSSTINITILANVAPTVSAISISSSPQSVGSDLNCSFTVTDPSVTDTLTANVSWYNNGALALSEILSVERNIQSYHILGSGNTTGNEVWHCGVIPIDQELTGSQLNSSTVLILNSIPPTVTQIQCQEDGSTWSACSNVQFADNLTAVRANCSDSDGSPVNVTFNFTNLEDSYTFFSNLTSDNSSGLFIFNNTDITIVDSGTFNVTATCLDYNNTPGTNYSQWSIAWGVLNGTLVSPSSNTNVTQNAFFNFSSQVTCLGGECGYVNATLDPWWNTSWTRRKEINITNAGSTALTNYPMYVNVTVESEMQSDYDDLRFLNGSCDDGQSTILDHEIDFNNSIHAEIWVRIPTLSTGTSTICMYYGNPQAANGENVNGVWNSDFEMVHHLEETSGDHNDSTSNDNDGTPSFDGSGSQDAEGMIGGADFFDGTNDVVTVSDNGGTLDLTTGEDMTFIAWVRFSTNEGSNGIIGKGTGWYISENQGTGAEVEGCDPGDACSTSSSGLNNNAWRHIVYVMDDALNSQTLYIDSVAQADTDTVGPNGDNADSVLIGQVTADSRDYWNGYIDEARIVDTALSSDWILQDYQSVSNQSGIVSLGAEEEQEKGAVSTTIGEIPFYTTNANPITSANLSCLASMTAGDVCLTTWAVNATGSVNSTWEFFVTYKSMNYSQYVTNNETSRINITIVENFAPNVTQISIYPATPVFTDNLTCSFVINDANTFDTLTANVTWYNNSVAAFNEIIGATNGAETNATLYFTNTSVDEVWHCGVIPSDGTLSGDQTNSSNVTILLSRPPEINEIQCLENGTSWGECSSLEFLSNFTGVRANCTSEDNLISNVTFNFTNVPDSTTYFINTTTDNSSGFWTYLENVTMNNSGEFRVVTVCTDNSSQSTTSTVNWTLPWGTLVASLIDPATDTNVQQNAFFTFTSSVECITGECGNINATLDPPGDNVTVVYNSSGNFTVPEGVTEVVVLVVAGGGGGGAYRGGGGGAGGLIYNSSYDISGLGSVINVTVGTGGNGGSAAAGSDGTNSQFGNLIAIGGGGGGLGTNGGNAGSDGGSGGGAGGAATGSSQPPGSGTANQGNDGGDSFDVDSPSTNRAGGGGGGAGATGSDAASNTGGDGGDGLNYSAQFGTSVGENGWFAGAGGGGTNQAAGTQGNGGNGGGGDANSGGDADDAINNTGGGGGGAGGGFGSSNIGGDGGSGVVIITYTEPLIKGIVSTVVGTVPFYTTDANPQNFTHQSCLENLIAGDEACQVSWQVNATGDIDTTWEFFVNYNMTTNRVYVSDTDTTHINITITDSSQVPPIVTLEVPADNTITSNPTVNFTCNATDNLGLQNMTLYANFNGTFTANGTNSLSGTSDRTSFIRTLNDGIYDWNCFAFDTNANSDWGNANWTITVDSTDPNVSLSAPADNENFTISSINFNFTVIDSLDAVLVCNITIDGSVQDAEFNANNNTLISRNIGSLAQGVHIWNVTCIDDAGNVNVSETRNFTIIDLAPTVLLVDPANNTAQQSTNIDLQYNATDNNNVTLARLILNDVINDTQIDPIDGTVETFSLTGLLEGRYNWTVNVSDVSNLTDQASIRWFIIDFTAPNITLSAPTNQSTTNQSTIDFNFTVIDNLDSILVCNITINGAVQDADFNANNNTLISRTIAGLGDGLNYWNVTCIDDATNINTSETRVVNISAPPTVVLNTPVNKFGQPSTTIELNYTPTDNTNIDTCTLILDGVNNATNNSVSNAVPNIFTLTGLNEGIYNWTVTCNDTLGLNATASPVRNFTIDSTNPNVTLTNPLAAELLLGQPTIFNYTVIDNIDINLSCNITLDGSVNISNIPSLNNTYTNRSITIAQDGLHYWNVTCIDDAGNINISETRNFTTANPPTITLTNPADNAIFNYSLNVTFEYLVDDSDGVANASLIINGVINQTTTSPSTEFPEFFYVNFSSDGVYTWTINATDNNNLTASATARTLTIDTTPPNVTLNDPDGLSNITWNNVTLNFTVIDILDSTPLCNISVNNTVVYQNISVTNNTNTVRYISLRDGDYNWSVACIDHANNTNTFEYINFTVEAPPNVTLNFPINNYRTNNITVIFNYTPEDSFGFENCTLFIDNLENETDTEITENGQNIFPPKNITEGDHNWTVQCIDEAPDLNSFTPVPENFTIDISGPSIVLNLPTPAQTLNNNNVTFNWTPTDHALNSYINCTILVSDPGGQRNDTTNLTSGDHNVTIPTLQDGDHYWNVTCSDDLGNTNTSETRIFTINQPDLATADGNLSFNNSNPNPNDNITILLNVTNIGGNPANGVIVEFWDGNSQTGTFIGNTTISVSVNETIVANVTWIIPRGYHVVNAYVDPANLFGELSELNNNATQNISTLIVNITDPINGTFTNDTTPSLSFNMSDFSGFNTLNYTIYVDGTANGQTGSAADNTITTINVSALAEGVHSIIVMATDPNSKSKNSTPLTITIDTSVPAPVILTANDTFFNVSEPNITIRVTDNLDPVLNYTLYVNGVAHRNGTISSGVDLNVSIGPLNNGTYTLILQGTDEVGQSANSTPVIIYIDQIAPVTTLNSPANNTDFTTTTVQLNYTVTDNLDTTLACNVTLDGSIVDSGVVANNTLQSYTASGLSEGNHYWNVTCRDSAFNENISETRQFNVFIAPVLNLLLPANNSITNNASIVFSYNVTDDTGIENCSLLFDGVINQTNTSVNNGGENNFTVGFSASRVLTWAIQCFDSTALNIQTTSENRTLTVDQDSPVPNIETINQTWFTTATPSINFNISDNLDSNISYIIYADGSNNTEGFVANDTSSSTSLASLSDGTHVIILEGTDDGGNAANSTAITIYIDTFLPNVTLLYPANNTNFSVTTITLNFTVLDNLDDLLVCNLTLDGSIIRSNVNVTNNTIVNTTQSGLSTGAHYWNATCVDNATNVGISDTFRFNIEAPDLLPVSLSFNESQPEEGTNISITANITNQGNLAATNITVQFFEGGPNASSGTQINGNITISSLGIGSWALVNVTYTTQIGLNEIFIVVDPPLDSSGSIVEENENNNFINQSFVVGNYHTVAGDTLDVLRVDDGSLITLFTWNVSNSTGSNVFVADTDSTIDFTQLQAISRTTSDVFEFNDFAEIDVQLGTSGVNDSINATWTSGGAARATRTFQVFSTDIANVAVVNSTNTSDFQTGLLWDYSDGGSSYNGTQDLLLVTEMNEDKTGQFGTYDYEIKIPATLRDYLAGTSTVSFYTEVK